MSHFNWIMRCQCHSRTVHSPGWWEGRELMQGAGQMLLQMPPHFILINSAFISSWLWSFYGSSLHAVPSPFDIDLIWYVTSFLWALKVMLTPLGMTSLWFQVSQPSPGSKGKSASCAWKITGLAPDPQDGNNWIFPEETKVFHLRNLENIIRSIVQRNTFHRVDRYLILRYSNSTFPIKEFYYF